MRISPTALPQVMVVESPAHRDARGAFQRLWCADEFAAAGLDFIPHQASLSTNIAAHTLRGMHWQADPFGEQKLVSCVAGRIWDVALDLRPDSPAYLRWHAEELSAETGRALFIPRGVAHGFLTLTPGAAVAYLIDSPHAPDAARGVRWNDPIFGIDWPHAPAVISGHDRDWPDHGHG